MIPASILLNISATLSLQSASLRPALEVARAHALAPGDVLLDEAGGLAGIRLANGSWLERPHDVAQSGPYDGWPCLTWMPLWPIQIINGSYCDPGYYCPHIVPGVPATYPGFCFPTPECAEQRMKSEFCAPQGYYEPQLCLAGYFCPNFTQMLPCPENTYCLRGSSAPKDCPAMSICPPMTEVRRFYGGIVYCLIVDVILATLFVFLRYYWEPRVYRMRSAQLARQFPREESIADLDNLVANGKAFELTATSPRNMDGDATEIPDYSGSPEFGSAKAMLENGFRKCNANLHLDLKFENLGLTLPPPISKTILSGVRGRIRPGRVTAIMGPSGAGKTTFLSVLMGKVPRTSGSLSINGLEDEMYRYRKIIGYVPQEDTMMRDLTVRENILFSARMRLPRSSWSDEAIQRHVDAVIEVLGLSHCADTLIGDVTTRGVSGGQRKRTNIGLELAVAPAAIFLDEPTSGLDSSAALEVCRTLRAIADLGLTVVAVIHQPRLEIFNTFDDLLLLAPGGVTAYMGPRARVMPYFQELGYEFSAGNNPADELLDFVAGKDLSRLMASIHEEGELDTSSGDVAVTLQVGSPASSVDKKPLLSTSDSAQPTVDPAFSALSRAFSTAWQQRGARYAEDHGIAPGMSSGVMTAQGVTTPMNSLNASADSYVRPDPDRMSADRGALFWRQVYLCHNRSVWQQYRQVTTYALEMGVCLLAGGVMGAAASQFPELYQGVLQQPYTPLSPSPLEVIIPSLGLYIVLAVGIAGSPAGVLTFGEEKPIYYREAAAGHNTFAYYLGKTVSVMYRFTFGALHFAALFMVLSNPVSDFSVFYGLVWTQFFCIYGLAAMVSMVVKRENAALLAVIVSLIAGTMCGYGPSLAQMRSWSLGWVLDMSFARWAAEAWFHSETLPYRHIYMVTDVSAALFGYTVDRFATDVAVTVGIGLAYRCVAYVGLVLINRDKQR